MARKKEETFERNPVSFSSTMRRNVHQSNILIQGKKNLDLMGMRLFLLALSTVNPHFSVKDKYYDKDFKDSFISSKDLKDRLGGTKYLAMLPQACKKLERATITVSSKFFDHETIYSLFHHFEYKPWEGIYFRFNNRLRPYILDLLDANGFTAIRLEHILKLTSVYAIRLLELLLQYQNLSRFKETKEVSRTLTIEQIRYMLNVPETAYKGRVDNLKRQVVRLPVKEINARTPYYLHFRTIKRGNRVVAFRFFMDLSKAYERPEKKIYFSNQALDRLRGLGFSDLAARIIYKNCKGPLDCQTRIINAEKLFLHQEKNIRNKLGFLRAAIENGWDDYNYTKNQTITKYIYDPQEDKEYKLLMDGNELEPIELKPKKKSSKRKKHQAPRGPVANPYSRVSIRMSRPLYPKKPPWLKNTSDDQNISAEDYQDGTLLHDFRALEKDKKKKENQNIQEGYYDAEQDKYFVVYPDIPEFELNRRFPPIDYADPDAERLVNERFNKLRKIPNVSPYAITAAIINEGRFALDHQTRAVAAKKAAQEERKSPYYFNLPILPPNPPPLTKKELEERRKHPEKLHWPPPPDNKNPKEGYYDVEQDKYIVVYPDTENFSVNRHFKPINYADPDWEQLLDKRLDEIVRLTHINDLSKHVALMSEFRFAQIHHDKAMVEKKAALERLNATDSQPATTTDSQPAQNTQATHVDDDFVDTRFYLNRRFPINDYTGEDWQTLLNERMDQIKAITGVPIDDIGIALYFEGAFAVDQRNAEKDAQNSSDNNQTTLITEFPNKPKYFVNRLFNPNNYTGDNWQTLLEERFNQIKKIPFFKPDKKGLAINHESAFALAQIKAARAAKKAGQDTQNDSDNQQPQNNSNGDEGSRTYSTLYEVMSFALKKIIDRQLAGATATNNQPPVNDDPSDTRYHVNKRFPPNDYTGPDWEELLYRRFADINRLTDITERELIDAKRFEENLAYEQHEKAEAAKKKRKQQGSNNSTPQSSATNNQSAPTVNQPAPTDTAQDTLNANDNQQPQNNSNGDEEPRTYSTLYEVTSFALKKIIDRQLAGATATNNQPPVNDDPSDTRYHVNKRFPPNDYTGPDWEELLYRRFADINRLTDITERELIDAKRFEENLAYEQHEKAEAAKKKRKQQGSNNSTPQSSATNNQSAPIVNQPAPTVNQPAPTVNQPAPTVNQPAPTVNQPAPTVNQSAPTVNQPAPIVVQPTQIIVQTANGAPIISFPDTPKYLINRIFPPNDYTGTDWRTLLSERLALINSLSEVPEEKRIEAQQNEAAMAMDQIKASLAAQESLSSMQQMTLNPIRQVIQKITPEEIETSILHEISDKLRILYDAYERSGKPRNIFNEIEKLEKILRSESKRLARREDLDELFRANDKITDIWQKTFEKMNKFLYDSYYIAEERTDGINSLVIDTLALTSKDGKVPKRIDKLYPTNDPTAVPARFIRVKGTLISDRGLKNHFEKLHQMKTSAEKDRLYEFYHVHLNELIVLYIKHFDDLP